MQYRYLNDLKLLGLRKAKSKQKLNQPAYGYLKVAGKSLKDFNNSSEIDRLYDAIYKKFATNYGTTQFYNKVYKNLQKIETDKTLTDKVLALKNSYYNSFDSWDQLSYLQFLMNYEAIKKYSGIPYYFPELLRSLKSLSIQIRPLTLSKNMPFKIAAREATFYKVAPQNSGMVSCIT